MLTNNGTTTLSVDAVGATGLYSATMEITYDSKKLTPVRCLPNHNVVSERPYGVALKSDDYVLAQRVVHFRAEVQAGTDLRYQWLFGDEDAGASGVYGDAEISHVYEKAEELHRHRQGVQPAVRHAHCGNDGRARNGSREPRLTRWCCCPRPARRPGAARRATAS